MNLKNWLNNGYDTIQEWDKQCIQIGLPYLSQLKTTSVKPSGTVSLFAGATPGLTLS